MRSREVLVRGQWPVKRYVQSSTYVLWAEGEWVLFAIREIIGRCLVKRCVYSLLYARCAEGGKGRYVTWDTAGQTMCLFIQTHVVRSGWG